MVSDDIRTNMNTTANRDLMISEAECFPINGLYSQSGNRESDIIVYLWWKRDG